MTDPPNACAGPFGAIYDLYIEREWLSRWIGRAVWGIDVRPMYASMEAIASIGPGATVLDAPCGGGVALRGVRPRQDVKYVGVDISDAMLERARRRAARRSLERVELLNADMRELPLEDESVDLCLSYSGLHMVPDPDAALREAVRCLKTGGELVGTTFLRTGSRRQRWILADGRRRGRIPQLGDAGDLRGWLRDAGIADPVVEPDTGFVVFGGRKG